MDDRSTRLLAALAAVPGDGSLLPEWEPSGSGVSYRGTGSALADSRLADDLAELADADYLERVFVERLSLCPSCGSHALNVHEACVTCASSNLVQFKALFHFRCGYVGPVTSFREEPQGLRCPKCHRLIKDLGTDHDSPGEYFRCQNCTAMFQMPETGARCLSCGARFTGTAMQEVGHRDVFAYRLTPLGKAALAEGRIALEAATASLPREGVARRQAMLEAVENARRNRIQNGKKFALFVVRTGKNGAALSHEEVADGLRRTMDREFDLGRLDNDHLVVLVPGVSGSAVKGISTQIATVSANGAVKAEPVDLGDSEPVSDALEFAARRIDKE